MQYLVIIYCNFLFYTGYPNKEQVESYCFVILVFCNYWMLALAAEQTYSFPWS